MKNLQDYSEICVHLSPDQRTALTIGNFDGVHRGHQKLIETLHQMRKPHEIPMVMTFEPHPWAYFNPTKPFARLFSLQDQVEQFQRWGILLHVRQPFTKAFSDLSPEQFLQNVLLGGRVALVVVGHDFRFGQGRRGDLELFREFCSKHGIRFHVVEPVKSSSTQEVISSSKIRELITQGEVDRAFELLGRPFEVEGKVMQGDQRGRHLGFPTANIEVTSTLVPSSGVYFTRSLIQGQSFSSITNVGFAPSARKEGELRIETHILDFQGDLYHQVLKVQFLKRLRAEMKFNSLDDLKTQIAQDVQSCKEYFRANS